jgi:hypothetical protein
MRVSFVAVLTLAGFGGSAAAQEQVRTDWGTFNFERDLGVTSGTVAGSAEAVYQSLKTILTDLGIKISREEPATHQLLVNKQRLVRQLGKQPIANFLSCGDGLTGPNANSWYVYLNLGAALTPAGAGRSNLRLALSADAIDVPGGRSDRVVCATTGLLELALIRGLRSAFPGTT